MKPILKSCSGLDVHRDQVTAAIATGSLDKSDEEILVKEFSTMTCGLRQLSSWLQEYDVESIAMESTGVFWKPVFNVLEDDFKLVLANAAHIKNVPGRKTDKKDARWIARLHRYGLVPSSFIPPRDIRDLRDLTRTRKKLTEEMTREKNRIQKVLQDGNIKLSSVVSDVFGVSGNAIIRELIKNEEICQNKLDSIVKGRLRKKMDILVKAIDGKLTAHHKFLLQFHLSHLDFLSDQLAGLDREISRKLEKYATEFGLLQTVPGLSEVATASIIAEIGVDMNQFPSEHNLCSWAAVCPGNNESAGKKKSGRTRRGNNYLKTTLVSAAWAASITKGTAISVKFHNIARRRGKKRAIMAIAHQLLKDAYRIMKSKTPYREVGAEAAQKRKSNQKERAMIKNLERLGYQVSKQMVTG